MSAGRIALIACGILIALGGLFLIFRAFSGAQATAAGQPDPPATQGRGGHGKAEEKAPQWRSFVRPGERETPPRPVARFARGLANPFDRLATEGGAGHARPASPNPGLRLEGVSQGAQPVALLSGRAVREGDSVSGFRVARIGRSGVTLVGPRGTRLGLTLGGGR